VAPDVGHSGVPELAQAMKLEWSDEALADLDRFVEFLNQQQPSLAPLVAKEIVDKVQVLSAHPQLGRPITGREEYRQIVLRVLGAAYVFQYRFDGKRLVMLRVFHAREARD
jgi:plasmid stabilization system protein ParE